MSKEVVLDLETQRGIYGADGRRNPADLKVSVCGVYLYEKDQFLTLRENQLKDLEPILAEADRVIGFNIKHFDFPVLQPYISMNLNNLMFLDMLEEVRRTIGHRIKLNSLAKNTLDVSKSGTGLDALKYFKEGKWDLLEKYCTDDVRITRDLYEFGKEKGYLLYHNGMKVNRIEISWKDGLTVPERIRESFKVGRRVFIEYPSIDEHGELFTLKRKIEVYYIKEDLIAAFCHLRKQQRTFRISRVANVSLLDETYDIPAGFRPKRWEAALKRQRPDK